MQVIRKVSTNLLPGLTKRSLIVVHVNCITKNGEWFII